MEDTATVVADLRSMAAGLRAGYPSVGLRATDLLECAADLIEEAWGCVVDTTGEDTNAD
jgi:hypothetical protein